jgi:DNA-binding Xre family transcriptional regulator
MCCPKRGQTTLKYLAITAKVAGAKNYNAFFADNIAAVATAKTRKAIEAKLPYLLAYCFMGQPEVTPVAQTLEDVPVEYLEGSKDIQTIWVEPAEFNSISLEIERTMKAVGVTERELAKRLGVSRKVVSKWLDPFSFSLKLDTLQRIASALGVQLEPPRFVVNELEVPKDTKIKSKLKKPKATRGLNKQ